MFSTDLQRNKSSTLIMHSLSEEAYNGISVVWKYIKAIKIVLITLIVNSVESPYMVRISFNTCSPILTFKSL